MAPPLTPLSPPEDLSLARLFAAPFRLVRPQAQRVPFLFASPHSGRFYPDSLARASRLDPVTLRRSEDAFVDELFADAPALGAPMLCAEFPRAFLDVNRAMGEIDAAMFAGPPGVKIEMPSTRVAAGLGVIPRVVRDGAEIYGAKLAPEEAALRLDKLYKPYHRALESLIEKTRARFGAAALIDCHSMPSGLAAPDIVLGDRYGVSAAPALSRLAEDAFAHEGFSVARNTPYAGGHTTLLYGRPHLGCHALQIEVNRGLYLDEERIVRKEGFASVRNRLSRALARLLTLAPAALAPAELSGAAE